GWRIIGQSIVPGMESGLAAADRMILIAPRVVVIGELVQRCSRCAHALIFESIGINAWRRLCDQRLIRNVGITLSWRLRQRDGAKGQPQPRDDYPRTSETHDAKCNSGC